VIGDNAPSRSGGRRSAFLTWLVACAAALWSAGAAAEPVVLTIGTTSTSLHYLPIHVATERTAAAEGLALRRVRFDSPAAAASAVAAGSVDVGLFSLNTALTIVAAGHPVRVFWVAGIRGDFEWFARDRSESGGTSRAGRWRSAATGR
jgi:ABC-type nitrate/sulfonate/bicarbonate transport system substrate-binding protein